jgi:hypothetical protein
MSFKQYKAEILKQELDIKPLKSKTKRDKLGHKRRYSIDFIRFKGKPLEYVLAPPKYQEVGNIQVTGEKTSPLDIPKPEETSSDEGFVQMQPKKKGAKAK